MRTITVFRAGVATLGLAIVLSGCAQPPANPTPAPTEAVQPPSPSVTPPPTAAPTPTSTTQAAASALDSPLASPLAAPTVPPAPSVRLYAYRVLKTYPHDPKAFTQGLVFDNGRLFESTGLRGQSSLREVDLETGEVKRKIDVAPVYFAEGLAMIGDRLFQLTWQEQTGLVYEKDTFKQIATWSYPTEGWGLAYDGQSLVMSDGSAQLRFLKPDDFSVTRAITVTFNGSPVERLNELEVVDGEIWANVWQTDQILRVDAASGMVTGVIDLTGLLSEADRVNGVDVLNGIAYDPAQKRLFVTGKLWPKLFEIELIGQP